MISAGIDMIRQGAIWLQDHAVILHADSGLELTVQLRDSTLSTRDGDFNAIIEQLNLDPSTAGYIIADAFMTQPRDSHLFLSGLVEEAHRIAGLNDIPYWELDTEDRVKLADFLYRPHDERPLPYFQWWNVLFPSPDDGAFDPNGSVNAIGLKNMIRTIIEYGPKIVPNGQSIEDLWAERGWNEYMSKGVEIVMTGTISEREPGKARIVQHSIADAYLGKPQRIERLIIDTIEYNGGDMYNLDEILSNATIIMKNRYKLEAAGYFNRESKETDRLVMLDTVIQGRYLD